MSWLDTHTFHHSEFSQLETLIKLKQQQQVEIAVVIPTLNEQRTIGDVIKVIRSSLMLRHPLVDRLIVVDSGSSDHTGEFAAAAGAEFFPAASIRPDLGDHPGKGENLWKSLHLLNHDLICFIDADVTNIHPRFVYGLIGPLLKFPDIHYVKGFYERPMASSTGVLPTGGGRLTEILVRPLFSLFYPELCQICQPLAGEYAARRSLLTQLAFPCGYGVETSHLIDILVNHGLSYIGQTDLEIRIHRNRSNSALSRASMAILQMFFQRLQRDHHITQATLTPILKTITNTPHGLKLIHESINDHERQPIDHIIYNTNLYS